MRPERWLQIKEIFDASVELAPDARAAFLADACRNDSPLLKEVESLIDSYARAGAFLEEPAGLSDSGAPDGMEGRRIGPYEVGPRIGAGGMGEVYRARDTRLNRTVAIKVRGDRIAWGVNLREQFAREAKAISALNHPHICLLHDVGHDDGIDFLVMEYVEGDPIHVHCDRGGLDVRHGSASFARCATRCTTRTSTWSSIAI